MRPVCRYDQSASEDSAERLSAPPTAFQLPLHLTSFSYSPTRELLVGQRKDEAIAHYTEPPLGADLNLGYEDCTWRDDSTDEGLDALLDTLSRYDDEDPTGAAADLLGKINVITWRGMMTKLMLAVYEVEGASRGRADGWELNAMIVDGTLYLEEAKSPSKIAKKAASESSYKLQSYYGYSFEAFSTVPPTTPPSPPSFSPPNTNVQWCSVVKTNLGGFRSILGGEVDCVLPTASMANVTTADFVELKTNIVINSPRDEMMFERQKLLKHYVQSFLLGVPRVIVGFRTRQGQLTALQPFKTLEIPRLVRGKPHAWDPLACLASARTLLSFLFTQISSAPSTRAYQGRFDSARDIHDDAALAQWPVFRLEFSPTGNAPGIQVRELGEDEVRRDVWGAKRDEPRVGLIVDMPEIVPKRDGSSTESINEKHSAEDGELAGITNFLDDTKGATTEADVEAVRAAAANLSIEDARDILRATLEKNQLDPNFPRQVASIVDAKDLSHSAALALVEEIRLEAALIDDSPYPEVRAVVSNVDDPDMPVNTFRVWVIGIFFTIIGTGSKRTRPCIVNEQLTSPSPVNTFFSPRNPSISFGTSIIQVLAYPMAKCFELFPARWTFLNPGPFNQKEHMLLTRWDNLLLHLSVHHKLTPSRLLVVMGNTGLSGAYINYIIFILRIPWWYNDQKLGKNAGFQVLLSLSTQVMGFAVAGLTRRFLVSFHGAASANVVANGWKMTRYRFFMIVFACYFVWYPVSNIAFQAITYFNWPTWIAPANTDFNGFGLNPISSFDWAWITYNTNPTITPLWSTLNQVGGFFFWTILLVPDSNTYNSGYLPMISNGVYDRFGKSFNVTKVMTDGILDQAKYEAYSPAYMSYTSGLVHGALYHHDVIIKGLKTFLPKKGKFGGGRELYNDVHNRLMRAYPEVPEWWFLIVFVVCLVIAIVHAEVYNTLSMAMTAFIVLPIGIITAVSNVEITFNVLAELIAGLFKTYGVEVPIQAIQFAQDLKLGHYMKIAPKHLFWGQLIPTIISALVAIGVCDWQLGNIEGICTATQKDRMYCLGDKTFATVYGFLVGAVLPFGPWLLARRYPRSYWKYVHVPATFNLALLISPYGGSWALAGLILALIVMGYVRRRYLPWWMKYNYVGTTALNAALALGGLIWFFILQYHDKTPDWYFGPASGWH
ncbi:hypothetical protein RQP46_010648 [Phenoliferia psychrophenolica]